MTEHSWSVVPTADLTSALTPWNRSFARNW